MRLFAKAFSVWMILAFCLLALIAAEAFADRPDVIVVASNLESSDGRQLVFVEEGLALGQKTTNDRNYVYTVIPDEFLGMPYIRPSTDSKSVTDLEITFDVDRPAYVYLFWQWNIAADDWLEDGFKKVMEKGVDCSWSAGNELDVWKSKEPFVNKVTLGACTNPNGIYIGMVLEASLTPVESRGKLSAKWGRLKMGG